MKPYRIAFLMLAVLFLASDAWSLTPVPRKGAEEPVKAEKARKSRDARNTPAPVSPVRKVTQIVEKIEGGILYTQGGQYDLNKVKVLDLSAGKAGRDPKKTPKKTAELTFVNDKLQEVVIRQRR